MTALNQYPFVHHPCFAGNREDLWVRIHLPVAACCNVKCIFCDGYGGASCHTSKPGYSSKIMSPDAAVERTMKELARNSRLRIIAISGPGEPLVNPETFATLQRIIEQGVDAKFCLSTNGVMLSEMLTSLSDLNISTISVSMSTQSHVIATRLYQWANINGRILRGQQMGKEIVSRQLHGIELAADSGICVKVNTILIPELNMGDIGPLSKSISKAGARLQNITPLIPCDAAASLRAPSVKELENARKIASRSILQFTHCKQCRSDVIGVPGNDSIL
jgi:nitrogen fixation protein NifB